MIWSEVAGVVKTVNAEVPGFVSGMIAPPEIVRRRKANCMGRLAIVAGGLEALRIVDRSDMRLLISDSRGMPNLVGKPWRGHAVLEVHRAVLVDARRNAAYLLPTSMLDWSDPAHPYAKRSTPQPFTVDLPGHPTPEILEANHCHTCYPIADGIVAYRQMHEDLSGSGEMWTFADYVNAYEAIMQ